MELIDREELLRKLDKMINFESHQVSLVCAWNTLLRAKEAVLECKVVDAEPVKHAKWIMCDLDGTGLCSRCGEYGNNQRGYCENCGAKMDLRDTDE